MRKLAWCVPHLSACNISESLSQVCVHGVIFSFKSGELIFIFVTMELCEKDRNSCFRSRLWAFCHLSLPIFYDTSLLASLWHNICRRRIKICLVSRKCKLHLEIVLCPIYCYSFPSWGLVCVCVERSSLSFFQLSDVFSSEQPPFPRIPSLWIMPDDVRWS